MQIQKLGMHDHQKPQSHGRAHVHCLDILSLNSPIQPRGSKGEDTIYGEVPATPTSRMQATEGRQRHPHDQDKPSGGLAT